MKETGQSASHHNQRSEACFGCKSLPERKRKKKLRTDGLPFRDELSPVLAPLVARFHPDVRVRFYSPEVIVFALLAAVNSRDNTLRGAVVRNNADRMQRGDAPASTGTSAFSEARSKLNPLVLIGAAKDVAARVCAKAPGGDIWRGMAPYVIDGTTLTAADTAENQRRFPQATTQAEGVGYPIMRVVVIQSLATGMIGDLALAPYAGKGTGEMALAREVMPTIPENSLLMGDRYFPSFFFLADLRRRGIHGIFPMHAARKVDFRKGKWLTYGDHAVVWQKPARPEWMSEDEYAGYPSALDMREMEVREKGNGRERLVLVTTLLDADAFPKADVARMYRQRWRVEVALRDMKDTFGLDHINANTPEMIEKIIWAHALAYNVLRWHMLNACSLYEVEPEQVSVKTAAMILAANATLILAASPDGRPRLFACLYKQMVQAVVGRRPGREEPRAIKRRPKSRALLKEPRKLWHERRTA